MPGCFETDPRPRPLQQPGLRNENPASEMPSPLLDIIGFADPIQNPRRKTRPSSRTSDPCLVFNPTDTSTETALCPTEQRFGSPFPDHAEIRGSGQRDRFRHCPSGQRHHFRAIPRCDSAWPAAATTSDRRPVAKDHLGSAPVRARRLISVQECHGIVHFHLPEYEGSSA